METNGLTNFLPRPSNFLPSLVSFCPFTAEKKAAKVMSYILGYIELDFHFIFPYICIYVTLNVIYWPQFALYITVFVWVICGQKSVLCQMSNAHDLYNK